MKLCDNYAAERMDEAFDDLDENFRFHWVAEPGLTRHNAQGIGPREFRQRLDHLHEIFEYLSYKPTTIVTEGDRVAVQVTIQLCHRTTGRTVDMAVADFWTVRNGRIVELVEYYDTALAESVLGPAPA